MTTTAANIDVQAVAQGVVDILNSLEGYLTTSMNPNRVALADLGVEPMGWTQRAHSPKAFQIWNKQHQIEPDDYLTIHHLAIMHHARAFDLEMGGNPAQADADWTTALRFWHRLHGCTAFWDDLGAKACAGAPNRKAIEELHAQFPKLILSIHYDIALDDETRARRPSRAKFHIGLAQSAPFDATFRAEARAAAYAKFIQAIPKEVWAQNELREEVVAKGTSVIEDYLLYDPGCSQALEDALRLQRRMQRARHLRWSSLDEKDPQRGAILGREKKDHDHWQPYFNQLVAAHDQLGPDVRQSLAEWYFLSGDSMCAGDKREEAVKCFETAALVSPDPDDRKKYLQHQVQNLALVACKKADKKDSGARNLCDKVRARDDLGILACLYLGQAYLVLFNRGTGDDVKLLDFAEDLCRRGLAIEPDFDDLRGEEAKEHLKSCQEAVIKNRAGAKVRALVSQGETAMKTQRFEEAVRHLKQAEEMAAQENILEMIQGTILWLRAQALIALKRLAEAAQDARAFEASLNKDTSPKEREAARELREMLTQAEVMKDVGPLLEKGKTAMERGKFAEALPPLNEAAKRSPQNGVIYFLRAQVHAALRKFPEARKDAKLVGDLAHSEQDRKRAQDLAENIRQAEAAAGIHDLVTRAKDAMEAGRFNDALLPLNEAAKKSPRTDVIFFLRAQAHAALRNFAEARKDVKLVADLAENAEDRERAQGLAESIREAETAAEINDLLTRSKQAMEAGRFKDALSSLNEAVEKSPRTDVIYFLRAQAYAATGKMTEAMRDVDTIEALAETEEDRAQARRLRESLTQAKAGSKIKSLLDKAQSALQGQSFLEAVQALDEAERLAGNTRISVLYFLRAQARAGAGDVPGAFADVMQFENIASSHEEKEAAKRLKEALFGALKGRS